MLPLVDWHRSELVDQKMVQLCGTTLYASSSLCFLGFFLQMTQFCSSNILHRLTIFFYQGCL